MRRRRKARGLGGTQEQHVTSARYNVKSAEERMAEGLAPGASCQRSFDALYFAGLLLGQAKGEVGWVRFYQNSDERLHNRIDDAMAQYKRLSGRVQSCLRGGR